MTISSMAVVVVAAISCAATPPRQPLVSPPPWEDERFVLMLKDVAVHLEATDRARRRVPARPLLVQLDFTRSRLKRSSRPVQVDFDLPVVASRCFEGIGGDMRGRPCPDTPIVEVPNFVDAQISFDEESRLVAAVFMQPVVTDDNSFGAYDVWILIDVSADKIHAACVPEFERSNIKQLTDARDKVSGSCTPLYVRVPEGGAVPWKFAPPEP